MQATENDRRLSVSEIQATEIMKAEQQAQQRHQVLAKS